MTDLDPQSNSSFWLLGSELWNNNYNNRPNLDRTSYRLFFGDLDTRIFERPYTDTTTGAIPKLAICPANFFIDRIEEELIRDLFLHRARPPEERSGVESDYVHLVKLGPAVAALRNEFHYTIFDCPPNLYSVTRNALFQSDYILIPCTPHSLSIIGLSHLLFELDSWIETLMNANAIEKSPILLGVVINRGFGPLDNNSRVQEIRAVFERFQARRGKSPIMSKYTKVFENNAIRERISYADAVEASRPMILFKPNSDETRALIELTQVIIDTMEEIENG